VTLPQDPTQQQLQLLRAGTEIEGVRVVPKVAKILQRSSAATSGGQGAAAAAAGGRRGASSSSRGGGSGDSRGRCVLRLDVSEGKKHEVRIAGVLARHTVLLLGPL
jgi:16S rRNA U516 pseudouridylate synthase RsuA-like enzyme